MRSLVWVLIALSAVGFIMAVVEVFSYGLFGVTAEGFSRGSSNLALLAIALMLATKKKSE